MRQTRSEFAADAGADDRRVTRQRVARFEQRHLIFDGAQLRARKILREGAPLRIAQFGGVAPGKTRQPRARRRNRLRAPVRRRRKVGVGFAFGKIAEHAPHVGHRRKGLVDERRPPSGDRRARRIGLRRAA